MKELRVFSKQVHCKVIGQSDKAMKLPICRYDGVWRVSKIQ